MEKNKNPVDNINLLNLIDVFWKGKFIIILFVVLSIGLSAIKIRNASYAYTVSMMVAPVKVSKADANLGNLQGLASLTGISIPTSSISDFKKFQILLTSEQTANSLFANEGLIKSLYSSEWSVEQNKFVEPKLSQLGEIKNNMKKLLTGKDPISYTKPDARRLANRIKGTLKISLDKKSNFLKISAEGSNPQTLLILMTDLVNNTDNFFKKDFLKKSKNALKFYKTKIAKARSKEHREVLARLISKEEQGLMLASSEAPFVAEVLLQPKISQFPTSPKLKELILIRVFFGLFIASLIILVRAYWPKSKEP